MVGLEVGTFTVMWGGRPEVHATATGPAAGFVAHVIRESIPDHTVSRADVAYDVDEPGAFDRLYKRVHELAREGGSAGGRKVSTETAGDWLDLERGRTFYAGGRTSRLRVRVYEKGHEQRSRDEFCGASLDWVRVEWQLRPDSGQSGWLARATPLDALGLTPFGSRVAAAVIAQDVEPVGASLRFASQDPGFWMAKQYRRVLAGIAALDPADAHAELVRLLDLVEPRNVP